MNQEYTEFEVRRDGVIDKSFKKKVKKIKVAITFIGLVVAAYTRWLIINPLKRAGKQIKHDVMLEYMDMFYKTDLKAQYRSGKRTQRILATKRSCGLLAS